MNTLVVFNEGLQHILKSQYRTVIVILKLLFLVKVVKLIRKKVFEWNSFSFFGSFPSNCQENSVSPTFKMFISMFLNDPNVSNQSSAESQSLLTIAQPKQTF